MKFTLVDSVDEVLDAALQKRPRRFAPLNPGRVRAGKRIEETNGSKEKAAKAGAGAYAAGKAVRSNTYVQRLVEDEELRDNLRNAFESAPARHTRGCRTATGEGRHGGQEGSARAADAATFKDAADSLRGAKKKKRRKGRLLLVAFIGGAVALAASEGLRKKVLDALFGAEEEFEYTASTTPEPSSTSEPVGTA